MKHNKEKPTTVSVDIGLFIYLQEKVCERKTKTEAYCNLLKKASENFVSPILKNRNQELNINQCHVTITDLSVEWHWHRSTVRSFLETLEEYGQIEIIRLPKSFLITMPVGINGNVSEYCPDSACSSAVNSTYRFAVCSEDVAPGLAAINAHLPEAVR